MWLTQRGEERQAAAPLPAQPAGAPQPAPRPAASSAQPGAPAPAVGAAGADGEKLLWQQRLERARHTLAEYAKATRYPPDSQPLREHPDRIHPLQPVVRTLPLTNARTRGSAGSGEVLIKLTQDRLHLTAGDAVKLTVRCEDSLSAVVSCSVGAAQAAVAQHLTATQASRFPAVPVDFAADRSQDGDHVAIFQPQAQGFRGYSGPLQVSFTVQAGGESGELSFDLLYTSDPPARFTGKVREAVEAGSLRLYAGIEVAKPGRYVITGRVFDSRNQPLGYLQLNEQLSAGAQELPLVVFGKLIRDESPVWPLTLQDLDGFLLYEDRDPDRDELAILAGLVYRTRSHSSAEFSADEWQSEERTDHLKEFQKDVSEAESHLP